MGGARRNVHGDGGSPEAERRRMRAAGLVRTEAESLAIRRRRCGRGFTYVDADGRRIGDKVTLARVRALAIPPAYADVRIAAEPNFHLQATGRDEAGRLQYLYHEAWAAVREERKSDRLATLCAVLPAIRRRVARALRQPGATRRKALAAAVRLIDLSHIRVGSSEYLHSGRSRGAATLEKRNVRCEGGWVHLSFHGKRRQFVSARFRAPALARALDDLRALPGRWIFQYRGPDGRRRRLRARDVNRFLREIGDADITAKDFRMLAATAAVCERLSGVAPASNQTRRRRQVVAAMAAVAVLLGNTPAVLRRSYVDRRVVEAFEAGRLRDPGRLGARRPELSRGEALVAGLLAGGEPASARRRL